MTDQDTEIELKKRIAIAYCQGLTQAEIATNLGVSQSTVSKLLKKAEKWIHHSPTFVGPITEEEKARLSIHEPTRKLREALEKKASLGWRVPKLHSFYGGSVADSSEWDRAVAKWSHNAAPDLIKLLDQSETIGIALGRTMRAVVDGLTALRERGRSGNRSAKPASRKIVFPLRGNRLVLWREADDNFFTDPYKLTANYLATDLNRLFNLVPDVEYAMRWHVTVPEFIGFSGKFAFHPRMKKNELQEFLKEEKTFLENFVLSCSVTRANETIFGKSEHHGGLCEDADTLLVPVAKSGTTRSYTPFQKEFAGIPYEWLEENTLGDIGTVLIPRNNISERDKIQLERIFNRQPGICFEHLEKCSDRAWRDGSKPGVIACAIGMRAAPVLSCIEQGIINHLFIDHNCAEDLLNQLR